MHLNKNKIKKAGQVLFYVEDKINCSNEDVEIYLDMYSNCREQGYSIYYDGKRVSFSVNRNSDDIVVYCGKDSEFTNGNIPNDDIYNQAKYFKNNEKQDAAKYIVSQLGI